MMVLSLTVCISIVLQGFVIIQAKSFLPEAVKYAHASSFNNTADLLHVVIETDSDENTIRFLDVVDNLLVDNNWSFRSQIDVNNKDGHTVSDYNLWFIDSYETFRRLISWIGNYHRDTQLFYLIVLKSPNTDQNYMLVIHKIFSDFLKLMVANVNILIETASGEVSSYTFYPYQEHSCRSANPFLLFKFNQSSMQHNNVSLFPHKANNFQGCPLRIKTRNVNILNLGYFEIFHIESVIVNELAARLNCTYDIIKAPPFDNILLNENSSGPHQPLANGEIDMVVGGYGNSAAYNHFLSKTVPYIMTWAVIAFRYRPYVLHRYFWLLISFDCTTWICIFLCLTVIAGCTFYVKKTRRFGSIVQLQHVGFLEILAVSLGTSVGHLPKKNCLRFIFVALSLAALVLRTAYLGKLFDAYRGLRMTQQPYGFMELLAENYTIYAHSYYASSINELTEMGKNNFEVLEAEDFTILSNTDKKSAIFTTFLFIYSCSTPEERRHSIIEPVFGEQICMFFQQHSIIQPRINEIIARFEEAGILHYLRKNYENINNSLSSLQKVDDDAFEQEQRPLGFEQFSFVFYLFLGLNVISCLVFAAELVWNKIIMNFK